MKFFICRISILIAAVFIISAGVPAEGNCFAGGENRLDSQYEDSRVRERWEIRVDHGERREFIFTNKVATHFSGESAGAHSRSYHGLFCSMHEYLDSWEFMVAGRPARFRDISGAMVYPHMIIRSYPDVGIEEKIVLPDERNGLIVRFSGNHGEEFRLRPWVDMRYIWKVPQPQYRIFWEKDGNTLLISRDDNSFPRDIPRWIAVTSNIRMDFLYDEQRRRERYPKDAARNAMAETFPFSPGVFIVPEGQWEDGAVEFVFALGESEDEASNEAKQLLGNFDTVRQRKLQRLESLLDEVDNPYREGKYRKAFRWAFASMDNLIMRQRGRGIYAGFHWFPTFWGRDSFISLPGACLAAGRFDIAAEILDSFMEYQKTDRDDPHLGRVPNIVNPDNLQYEGVDGTWWLARAAWKYIIDSGDREFMLGSFRNIRLALDGALEKAADEQGFLAHKDWETWMDAGGSSHPYSPRGDRAVEVQALFHYGLLAGASWARTLAGGSFTVKQLESIDLSAEELVEAADRWLRQAAVLGESFRSEFWDPGQGYLFDHLNPDGSPDPQIRPNALLAMMVSLDEESDFTGKREGFGFSHPGDFQPLLTAEMKKGIVDKALESVILDHGVTSLSPDDPGFHPCHLNLDKYFYDEAYHNGDVWEWLTGPAVTCLMAEGREAEAKKLFQPLVDEILSQACVGSLREIQDGRYTPGKDEFGGATSQAWSLAEFIRVSMRELNRPEKD
ncbi:MAG: amylo-alpha-1,6-glucosidase [Candidatus Krumholzibacteriales bacterium]